MFKFEKCCLEINTVVPIFFFLEMGDLLLQCANLFVFTCMNLTKDTVRNTTNSEIHLLTQGEGVKQRNGNIISLYTVFYLLQ